MRKHLLLLLFAVFSTTCFTFAQSTKVITGKLLDAQSKEPLIGATIAIKGTTKATTAALDGSFKISVPSDGATTLVFSYIGYVSKELSATGPMGTITLDPTTASIKEVVVTGTQTIAIARHTPIAVSAVNAQYIEEKGAGAEFPELLKETPGVTVSRGGGGYGDSRIAIRGFNSNNVALLINGLPANDPEAGRIFWNDWAGLSDVTTSMQVQRGLGASTVAVPSLGGTINITTRSTEATSGGAVSQSIGSYNASKTLVTYSTGLTDKGWASSFLLSKSSGDGNREGLYYTGYNYFLNISKIINKSHTISANVMGASQNHGQGFTYLNINTFRAAPQGATRYNSDYGYQNGQLKSAEVNFYNKPLASLTHSWTINPTSSLSTVVYGTWGTGAATFITGTQAGLASSGVPGGSTPRTGGTYGPIDFDAIVRTNLANPNSESTTILQNAANDHNQYGLFSTYKKKIGENIDILAGLDLRTYRGFHYYKVNDLLGGAFFTDNADKNNPNRHVVTGDRINRNYYVDLMSEGLYVQGEYSKDKLSAVVALAVNNTGNRRTDFFNYAPGAANATTKWINFLGFEAKAGLNYNIDNQSNVFGNIGYLQRAPLIATVFLNNQNDINKDAKPEKLYSFELGYAYTSSLFSFKVNSYYSPYRDRAKVFSSPNTDGTIATFNVTGINEVHEGVELETAFRPVRGITLRGMLSVGNYYYTSNTGPGQYTDDKGTIKNVTSLALKNIKIGDFGSSAASNAQTTANVGLDVQALPQLKIGGSMLFAGDYFASFDPSKITGTAFETTKFRPLGLPNYTNFDLNFVYRFKFAGLDASFIGNVYNLLNTQYISEGYEGTPSNTTSDAARLAGLGVNYGVGRYYMTTLKIKF